MHNKKIAALAAALLLAEASGGMAQTAAEDVFSLGEEIAGPVEGANWRLEALVGRGYETNVHPAPPSSLTGPPPPAPPTPLPGPPPPTPPAVTSSGGDHINTLQFASTWHYRSPAPPTGVMLDWPTRLQALLTRYDTFSYANRDEFSIVTMPGWIYGDNETRFSGRFMKTREDGEAFLQEYTLRLLQTKTLRPPYGFAFGMDRWEQKFDHQLIALEQDHRRSRLVAGVVGNFPRHSRFALLATAGHDEGLRNRDDYDVRGLELNMRATLADKLTVMLLAEYEEGDSVQNSGSSSLRRKVDVRARYRLSPLWLLGFGYKLDRFEAGTFAPPGCERYEVTFGLEL